MLNSLKDKTVGIAGCGGLGSNCAVALARVGIGHLVLADFDVVTESNLNRQYFFRDQIGSKKVEALKSNLLRINPDIRLSLFDIKLDAAAIKQIFSNCDVIVEAFDLAEMKQMIIETVALEFPETFLVSGIGLAGWGLNNRIHESTYGKLIVCGDESLEVSAEYPPLGPRVGIVSNMQANAVLEILLGKINPE